MKLKGHHYITEGYQRLFGNDREFVWVLDATDKLFETNPTNVFKEGYFYRVKLPGGGGTLVVEKTLGQIEGQFVALVRDKIEKKLTLAAEDRAYVAMFVAAMLTRTKIQREHMRGELEKLKLSMQGWKKQFEMMSPEERATAAATPSGGGTSISMDDLQTGLEDFDSHHSTMILSTIDHAAPLLEKMNWTFLEAPDGKEFITSDNPFCMCAPAREKEYGIGAFGASAGLTDGDVEVTFPLSKRVALAALWKDRPWSEYEVADDRMVDQINIRSARTADSLISSNPILLEEFRRKLNT